MHRQIAGKLTGRVTKWVVLVFWVLAVGVLAPFGAKLTEVQNNEASSWLPDSAESTRVVERLASFQDPNAIPTVVVYERSSGLTPEDLAAAAGHAQELAALDGVVGDVLGPFPSEDGRAAQTVVTFDFGPNGWEEMPDVADDIRDLTETDGVDVYVTGAGGQAADSFEAFASIDGNLLLAALVVVVVILLFTYRSPVLWLLPILSVVAALQAALGVVYFLARDAGLTVNGQSQAILSILVIGAGTDYALLLVARYREELRRHGDRHEAMAFALHRAAPAILASAGTVALGMLCLLFADLSSTAGLGPVVAVGVAITYLAMVTLLPALLVITGRWVFWPKRPHLGSAEPTDTGLWAKVGAFIAPRPRRVWLVTGGLLLVASLGLVKLDVNGLSTDEQYTKDFDSVVGQRVQVEHGLVDESNPIQVAADTGSTEDVVAALRDVPGLGKPTVEGEQDGVAFITAAFPGDPASEESFDLVEQARDAVHAVDPDAAVGGWSAIYLDTMDAANRDNLVIIPLILVVVLLILMTLLRAVAAPLILAATVVLSFAAALGISALVFDYVFPLVVDRWPDGAQTDPGFPLYTFVFLVALGIDYNIFLMTRVREETVSLGTREGSLRALSSTGGVITSAGIVLAATFLVLGTLPLVGLAQTGFTVALGVLLDTMIVRSVLVTAINLDLGGRIWWPSALDRKPPVGSSTAEREPVAAGR